jgi:hypothetical protein
MLKRLALGLLVAWAAAGFLQEVNQAVAGYDDRAPQRGPWAWRFGTAETEDLTRCLQAAQRLMPAGSTVAFTSEDPPEIQFARWRWAAYLLPAYDVIPVSDPATGTLARYAIAYRTKIDHPRAELMSILPHGWLYRVKPPQ